MLVTYSRTFFRIARVWFSNVNKFQIKAPIVRYERFPESNQVPQNAEKGYTLYSSLEETEDEIFNKFKKTTKYEIRKIAKENVQIQYFDSSYLKNNRNYLIEFKKDFKKFCNEKRMPELFKTYKGNQIKSYLENNCCILAEALFENIKVYHFYIFDDNTVVLLYSVSCCRNEMVNAENAGMVNKFFHYKDMIYFKKNNYKIYDWGGISSFEQPNGVDIFKMNFGGVPKNVYFWFEANSVVGKVILKCLKKI